MQLHYYPNTLAQNLATSKSHTIGVIVPYLPKVRHLLSTYYFSEIISGIGDQLATYTYYKKQTKTKYAHCSRTNREQCPNLGHRTQRDDQLTSKSIPKYFHTKLS